MQGMKEAPYTNRHLSIWLCQPTKQVIGRIGCIFLDMVMGINQKLKGRFIHTSYLSIGRFNQPFIGCGESHSDLPIPPFNGWDTTLSKRKERLSNPLIKLCKYHKELPMRGYEDWLILLSMLHKSHENTS